jgi:hypothetical protein
MKTIKIVHLYPERMNIYGDYGNIIALQQRMSWRDIKNEVVAIDIKDKFPDDADIVFIGGGQDKGQVVVAEDLANKQHQIHEFIESGGPLLAICGGYQLLGEYFISNDYGELPGIKVFNIVTKATDVRMIGNIIVDSEQFGQLVGFENHSGATEFVGRAQALGKVKKGYGNNSKDKLEGIIYKQAIGSYMHGPFLPKNPIVCDWLIEQALKRNGDYKRLIQLDDTIENFAHRSSARRP